MPRAPQRAVPSAWPWQGLSPCFSAVTDSAMQYFIPAFLCLFLPSCHQTECVGTAWQADSSSIKVSSCWRRDACHNVTLSPTQPHEAVTKPRGRDTRDEVGPGPSMGQQLCSGGPCPTATSHATMSPGDAPGQWLVLPRNTIFQQQNEKWFGELQEELKPMNRWR